MSDWTTIEGGSAPAFRFVAPPAPSGGTLNLSADDYLSAGQRHAARLDAAVLVEPVDGARGYFVVVARDKEFTKIVDLAFTNVPAYAPRRNRDPGRTVTRPPPTGGRWSRPRWPTATSRRRSHPATPRAASEAVDAARCRSRRWAGRSWHASRRSAGHRPWEHARTRSRSRRIRRSAIPSSRSSPARAGYTTERRCRRTPRSTGGCAPTTRSGPA